METQPAKGNFPPARSIAMPDFKCKLVDEQGAVKEEILHAESKYEIYEQADTRGELVLSVKSYQPSMDVGNWLKRMKKVKPDEIERFTSQLATLLNAGVPLLSSLETLIELAETKTMRDVIRSLADKLNSGQTLSQAMSHHPRVFSPMYSSMIRAGEKAGVMDIILKRLSAFYVHDITIRSNIISAIRYPIIVFSVLIMAFTLAIIFVIPRFAKLYGSQGVALPLPTRILIGINLAVTHYWLYTLVSIAILVVLVILFLRTPRGKRVLDSLKLRIPIFKELLLKNTISRFAHMLETLIHGGIQIISAMETVEETIGNIVIGEDIAKARQKVSEGSAIAAALSKSKYFPPITLKMISVGEQSGALEEMLIKVADQYDSEVEHLIKRLTAMVEPLMTVVIGAFLMLIALGIFLPMWNIYSVF